MVADPETLAVAADRVPALVDSLALARSVGYVVIPIICLYFVGWNANGGMCV